MADDGTTHAYECWNWGPRHYECAVRRLRELMERERHLAAAFEQLRAHCGEAAEGFRMQPP